MPGAEDEVERLLELQHAYADIPMSLADACLVRMTVLYVHSRVITMDSDFHPHALPWLVPVCHIRLCRLLFPMSTLTLEKLPESVDTLAALIREGKIVRLTEKGHVVATVAPKSSPKTRKTQRSTKPKMTVPEFIEKYLDNREPRPDRDFTALLRAARDRE